MSWIPKRFRLLHLLVLAGWAVWLPGSAGAQSIRVMSFNLWHGGDAGKQPLDQTVAVIRAARADVVGLQETAGIAPDGQERPDNASILAQKLGWNYLDQGGRTGVLSRFPIVGTTPDKWGVELEMPSGQRFQLFNAHLAHAPYQPYQLLRIPYADAPFLATAEEAVRAAREARGEQVTRMLAEVKAARARAGAIFLTGDFNEPSHLDWTPAVFEAHLCPASVAWPSTRAVVEAGFVDGYRAVHPDPVADRGITWTPTTRADDPKDRHDRIDFVFAMGAKPITAEVLGESREAADLVVTPYPSDHRAVVVEFELPKAGD
jgi:endonuclease/exonuclease/phosphatase family metal-dependent hydrolase